MLKHDKILLLSDKYLILDSHHMKKNESVPADFDSPWKDILDVFFQSFMKLFFPKVHDEIDWSKKYESLDKELNQITNEAAIGKRIVDKLLKVYRKNGKENWVNIHVEVQSQKRPNVAERMYIYNCLLYLHFKKPVMSLLVLGDDSPNWRPECFKYEVWGSRLSLEFQTVKLLDYRKKEEELIKSPNPFAFFVLAHLKTLASKKDVQLRFNYKEEITKKMLERGFSEYNIYSLLKFIDTMMTLPFDLEQEFMDKIYDYMEEKKMPTLAPFEKMWLDEGIEKGIEKGRNEGILQEAQNTIVDILNERFGEIPSTLLKSVKKIEDHSVLRDLRIHALKVNSIKEFKKLIHVSKKQ